MTKIYMAGHAFLKKDGKFLFLHRSNSTRFMPSKWDVPGGTVETGETVEQAIVREFLEETKLNVKVLNPIFIHTNLLQMPDRQTFQAIYIADYLSGEITLNPREHQGYKWLDVDDIIEYDIISFLVDFIQNTDYKKILNTI